MITKSNAQRHAYVLWDDVLEQIEAEFADVACDKQHADAAAMNLVRRPESFDVIVASNLFGDILTDLAGTIAGGLGLAPSTNTNPERTFPSMFEPVHGSALTRHCRGAAWQNLIAAVLSGAMMLDWLGAKAAGDTIRAAVERTVAAGHKTADMGGRLSTVDMGDRIIAALADA